jgi:YgiT-type zinc finger domain-containing protein
MVSKETDLPFKIADRSIAVVKSVPVHECGNCGEILMDNPVMEAVERLLESIDENAELEIVQYAA